LEAIAIRGEIIAVEARLCAYDGIKSTKNVNQLSAFLDDHQAPLQRSRAVVCRSSETKDHETLLRETIGA
jgi:hypothetical protein